MRNKILTFSHETFASLGVRNYRLYFIGQGISVTGSWMQSVAQSWLVLQLTHSGTALGVAAALQCLPTLALGPYAGVLAERVPKRRLLLVTQAIEGLLALALGVLVATDSVQLPMVYVLAAALGIVTAIDYPTRQSFMHDLVGPRVVGNAVSLNATLVNIGRVAGPALAAALIAAAGLAVCFLANAVSFAVVLVCLVLMRESELHVTRRGAESLPRLAEGLAYVRRTPLVLTALVMMAVIGALTYEFSVTLPLLAKFEFGGEAQSLGSLMAGMGLGAALGGIVNARQKAQGMGQLSVAALGFGLSAALVGFAPNLTVAVPIMFVVGVFSVWFTATCNTILQVNSAPRMRTQVMALWSVAFVGSSFLGGPLVGWVGEQYGPPWALAVAAIGGLLAAGLGLLQHRRGRVADARAEILAPEARQAEAAA